jgi:hypothetical protein
MFSLSLSLFLHTTKMGLSSRIYVSAPGVLMIETNLRQHACQYGRVVFAVCRGCEAIVRFASRGEAAAALQGFSRDLRGMGGYASFVGEKRMLIYGPSMERIANVRNSFASVGRVQSITAYDGDRVMAVNFADAKSADMLMAPGPRWLCNIEGVDTVCSLTLSAVW